MKDCLTVTAKFFAVVFAVLFVILTAFILMFVTLEASLFNPETYKRALIEKNVYQRLPSLFADQLIYMVENRACLEDPSQCFEEEEGSSDEAGSQPAYFQNLSAEDWEYILSILVTTEWVQEQTESLIDQTFNFLASDQPELTLTFSLVDIKKRLAGEQGLEIFDYILRAQPACTVEQLIIIAGMILSGELSDIPACLPPIELISQLTPLIHALLGEVVETMPDQAEIAHLAEEELEGPGTGYSIFDLRTTHKWARLITRLSLIIPAGLLILILVLGVRSIKGWLLWWGILLLATGLLLFVMVAFSGLLVNLWVTAIFRQAMNTSGVYPELVRLPMEIGMAVMKPATLWLVLEAALLTLFGLVMVVVSFFVRAPHETGSIG